MMQAIDLFSGTGGATLGMQRAGIEVMAGVEHNAKTALAYSELTGVETVVGNVGSLHPNDVLSSLSAIDLAWASPPCQPYSSSGRRRGANDARDGAPALMAFIERFRPAFLVVEEVPTFASFPTFGRLLGLLRDLGYGVEQRVLNAADYGVPQTRRRLFIVARRDGRPWRWTMATHTKDPDLFTHHRWVSMNDVVVPCLKQRPPDAQRLPPWIASRWWQLPQGRRDEVFVHSQLTSKSDGNRDWLHVRTLDLPAFTVTTTTTSNAGYVVHGGEYWRV